MDKVIVITGASGGIGAELARVAGARGAKLVLAARRKDALETVATRSGRDSLAVVTDVTSRAQVEALRDAALQRFGHIDVWVNNAGRGITRSVADLTDEDLEEMWRANVNSALYGMQAVLPHFQARNAGQILNVSSTLGRLPVVPHRSAYSAAKHALNALSACLRQDLHKTHPGIHVTVVMPGVVATEFGTNALGGGPDSRMLPGAQRVEEAVEVILDAIAHPCPEVFTRPAAQQEVERYYRDVAAYELDPGARPGR
ncbi:SDR family NAD(P)-dependent oxidoreductase [Myxococcus sp. MISCRS1]|uniref:SDR family oxidoreductase n=1 Tax=Myxococcus sp. MISCRS1 TaxID=2996786 RepID=UPI002271A528|nr:SDR family NAD(P)-dependent oxidoreductase [Myxococcus sp. MISCRS1]MCY0995780.1 SDR family NAD(P)-dependent oxidoreductase [Myxococcus sp. MISCRS1]